jgi:hypothetical protein
MSGAVVIDQLSVTVIFKTAHYHRLALPSIHFPPVQQKSSGLNLMTCLPVSGNSVRVVFF